MLHNKLTILDGENTWYLTYCDATHFFFSNSNEHKGNPYHIGQFRSESYYTKINEWLREETNQLNQIKTNL